MSTTPSNTRFIVRAATPVDAAAIARVQNASFVLNNPRLRPQSVEDPEGFERYQVDRNSKIMAGDEGVGMSWTVAQDAESGEIVCVMRTEKIEDALAVPYKPITSVAYGGSEQAAFFDAITKVHRMAMGSRPHYCLHIMATHPAHQGRGAARALLQHMVDLADEQGLPVYLEATPEAVPVYRKFGWLETGATELFPTGAAVHAAPMVVTMMLREPRSRVP